MHRALTLLQELLTIIYSSGPYADLCTSLCRLIIYSLRLLSTDGLSACRQTSDDDAAAAHCSATDIRWFHLPSCCPDLMVAIAGLEPTIPCVWNMCFSQLSYIAISDLSPPRHDASHARKKKKPVNFVHRFFLMKGGCYGIVGTDEKNRTSDLLSLFLRCAPLLYH